MNGDARAAFIKYRNRPFNRQQFPLISDLSFLDWSAGLINLNKTRCDFNKGHLSSSKFNLIRARNYGPVEFFN